MFYGYLWKKLHWLVGFKLLYFEVDWLLNCCVAYGALILVVTMIGGRNVPNMIC